MSGAGTLRPVDRTDLAFAGVATQAELVRTGEVSSRELVELYLERIERLDPQLNAFRTVLAERALAEADQAQSRRAAGEEAPLLGVPVAIKDNQDLAGEVTAQGTGGFDEPAAADSEIVRRLRTAGAIPIGKTHLPELAVHSFTESKTWGITRNPWNPDRSSGGSSGGSGTAVAAGLAGIATANDGGGSIRIPAACCGLFGLKPQRGRVSLLPDRSHWHGLTVAGCLSRSVLDTALFLDVVSGHADGDADVAPAPPTSFVDAARCSPGKLRIAVSTKPVTPVPVDQAVKGAVADTAGLLRGLGHDVREQNPAWGMVPATWTTRFLAGTNHDVKRVPHPQRLERRTRTLARWGSFLDGRMLERALAAEAKHAARLGRLFEDVDVLLTPTVARPSLPAGKWEGRGAFWTLNGEGRFTPFATPWNVTGQPAAAVPAGFTEDGLPLSVQLVGRPGDETTLLSLAGQIEAERPWAGRRPDLAA
jgi:amidase